MVPHVLQKLTDSSAAFGPISWAFLGNPFSHSGIRAFSVRYSCRHAAKTI